MQNAGFDIFKDLGGLQSIAPESTCTKPNGLKKLKHAGLASSGSRLHSLKSKNANSVLRTPFKRALGDVSNKIHKTGGSQTLSSKKELEKLEQPTHLLTCSSSSKATSEKNLPQTIVTSKDVLVHETTNVICDVSDETFLPIEIFPDVNEDDDNWDFLPSDHRFTSEDIYRIVNLREHYPCQENYPISPPLSPIPCTIEVPFYDDFKPPSPHFNDEDTDLENMPFLPDFPLDEEGFLCDHSFKQFD